MTQIIKPCTIPYISDEAEELLKKINKEDLVHLHEHVYYSDYDRDGPKSEECTLFLILQSDGCYTYNTYTTEIWCGTSEPYELYSYFTSPVLFKPPLSESCYRDDEDPYDYEERIYNTHMSLKTIVHQIENMADLDLPPKIIEGATIIKP